MHYEKVNVFTLCIPVVFALLPDKARMTYNRMFDAIKGIQPNLAPDPIMTDFELTLHRSIRDAFLATYSPGC